MKVPCQYGAYHHGACQYDASGMTHPRLAQVQYDAGPVWRTSLWRRSSMTHFSMAHSTMTKAQLWHILLFAKEKYHCRFISANKLFLFCGIMCGLLAEQIIVYWTVTISVSFLPPLFIFYFFLFCLSLTLFILFTGCTITAIARFVLNYYS